MLAFDSGNLIILNEKREILYPQTESVNSKDVFIVFQKFLVIELLQKGRSEITVVEQRSSTITITNGLYTLEFGSDCPPWCG